MGRSWRGGKRGEGEGEGDEKLSDAGQRENGNVHRCGALGVRRCREAALRGAAEQAAFTIVQVAIGGQRYTSLGVESPLNSNELTWREGCYPRSRRRRMPHTFTRTATGLVGVAAVSSITPI